MDSPKPSEAPESKLHFLDYWRIIRVRKAVIIAVFILVSTTATVITFFQTKAYSSKVRISVEKDVPVMGGLEKAQSYTPYDPFWLQTEFEKIKSQSVLDLVIKDMKLNELWAKKFNPDGGALTTEETRLYLKRQINVQLARNTTLIEIEVISEDKQEAADIANKIADIYKTSREKQRGDLRGRGINELKKKHKAKEVEIEIMQKSLSDMRTTNSIPDLDDNSPLGTATLNTETLRQLERNRVEAQSDYLSVFTLVTNLASKSRAELRSSIATAIFPPDSGLNELLSALAFAEQKLASALQEYAPDHPDVKRAQAVAELTSKQVDQKITGIMEGLETRVRQFKLRLEELDAAVERAQKKGISLAKTYRPYFDSKRDLESLKRVRDALGLRIDSESVESALPTTIVDILDHAEPGLVPVRPRTTLQIALGVIVGLIVGVGLAFFIEYLDTSVKTIDDVERALQAPVLGVIPQNVGSLLDEGPESPHAEAYRVLRTNILFSRKDEKLNSLSVVSGGAGEGKSTTLFNLATIFAQNGHRVLIVDSDLRRPSIHKILRVSNSVGLTNYLLKQNSLEEVIQTTGMPTLDFLPSGKLPSSSMGILSSAPMKIMIQELKRRYDFVFFDSPPIMGVSDASILASEVDMVLQVIQYRRYPQPMTIRAKQMIQKVGGNLLGIVLNNINMSQDENYYYYSGYYYDYYSKHDDDDDDDTPVKPRETKKTAAEMAKVDLKSKY